MTIICALRDDVRHEVWIGADSRAVSDTFIWPHVARKLFRCGKWTIGVAGTALMGRLIRECGEEFAAANSAAEIWDFMRAQFETLGFKADDSIGPKDYHQEAVVCDRNHIWHCATNGVIAEMEFTAIGSGGDFAYGAWYAVKDMDDLTPKAKVLIALEAACAFDSGCGGELVVENVK